jgi:hypothetical protein
MPLHDRLPLITSHSPHQRCAEATKYQLPILVQNEIFQSYFKNTYLYFLIEMKQSGPDFIENTFTQRVHQIYMQERY